MSLPRSYFEYPHRHEGMDHTRFGYANLFRRSPVKWPGGARVALVVVPVLEWFPLNVASTATPVRVVGGMERPYPDYWNYTMRDYGTRVGVFRIFKVLDELGIPASVAINAGLARRHPFLLREITRRNWELVAHGLDMGHIAYEGVDPEQERATLDRAVSMLRADSGQKVSGWLSPMQSESHATPDLLASHGLRYTLDWNNDDLPVRMSTQHGPLYGVPFALDISDRLSVLEFNLSNAAYTEQLVDCFTTLWREAEHAGGRVMSVAAHSWLTGQANRVKALRDALEIITRHPHVWPTTYDQMLDAYVRQEH
jgi:allantoinase